MNQPITGGDPQRVHAEDLRRLVLGEITAEDASEAIARAAADLAKFLEDHHGSLEAVLNLLNKQLTKNPDSENWQRIQDSLEAYLGSTIGPLLVWVFATDQKRRLQFVKASAPQVSAEFLDAVVAFSGPDLELAYIVWNENPHDWRIIRSDVFYDNRRAQPLFRLQFFKYNGETAMLELPGSSLLRLIRLLMTYASLQSSPGVYKERDVTRLLEEVGNLVRFLRPPKEPTPEQAPEREAAPAATRTRRMHK